MSVSRDFPDWINPWTAAQGKRRFAGTVPLKRMKRLLPSLYRDGEGGGAEASAFEARFALDDERRPVIDLAVEADLELLCQASLEPYVEHIARQSTLAVVETDGEIEVLPLHYDPVFADHGRIALATLVEDELILGLPAVPRNPELGDVRFTTGEASDAGRDSSRESGRTSDREATGDGAGGETSASASARAERPNPFAVLKGKVGGTDR